MFRSLRHIRRLLSLARLLARHDALFALEMAGVSPALLKVAGIGAVSYTHLTLPTTPYV